LLLLDHRVDGGVAQLGEALISATDEACWAELSDLMPK